MSSYCKKYSYDSKINCTYNETFLALQCDVILYFVYLLCYDFTASYTGCALNWIWITISTFLVRICPLFDYFIRSRTYFNSSFLVSNIFCIIFWSISVQQFGKFLIEIFWLLSQANLTHHHLWTPFNLQLDLRLISDSNTLRFQSKTELYEILISLIHGLPVSHF